MENKLTQEEKDRIAQENITKARSVLDVTQNSVFEYGSKGNQKENDEEYQHLNTTNDKYERVSAKEQVEQMGNLAGTGYYNIPIESLPSYNPKTGFCPYPEGTVIHFRAATGREIAHYSTMDESDATGFNMSEHMDMIIESCTRVKMPLGRKNGNWTNILESDRTYILFAIQELTLPEKFYSINVPYECPHCEHENNVGINKDVLGKLEFDERIQKYWDPEERCFDVKTKDPNNNFKIYLSNIGTARFVREYIMKKYREGKTPHMGLIKTVIATCPDHTLLNEKYMRNMNTEIQRWPVMKMPLLLNLYDLIVEGINTNITYHCENCGEEVTTQFRFPDGAKSIFVPKDVFDSLA